MKRTIYHILVAALTLAAQSSLAAAPPVKEWQKCIGGSLQDIPGEVIHLRDGNILLLANVNSSNGDIISNHGSTDIWLSKMDATGTIIWQKSFGGTSIDAGTGISELSNGNIIISGYSSSNDGDIQNSHGNFDILLICTDNSGNLLWTKNYGGSQVDLCYTQTITKDGGIILGGGSYSNDGDVSGNHGNQDFWLMKIDTLGNILWQRSAGGSDLDVCYGIAEDISGNLFACGTTNSNNGDVSSTHGNYDLWVVKYDASGNTIWNKTFGGTNYETAQTIIIDSHQHILIGGFTHSSNGDVIFNYGYGDSWIIQIDASGNLLSKKSIGGSGGENLYSIIETADGGYLLTSGTTSNDHDIQNSFGQEDIWLYKTDASLNVEWNHNYGGSGNDRPVSVIQNQDGGFLIAGYTYSNDNDVNGLHGSSDIWLMNLSCKVPAAFFSTQTNACLDDTLTFFDASTFASEGNWMVNNVVCATGNTAQIQFPNVGIYHVTLNVQTCYYSASHNSDITVTDCKLPQVSFITQENSICANSSVEFTDASVNATAWQWTFPGGTPASSTLQNPTVVYSQPGVYSVMLSVSNSFGSMTSMRLNYVTVHALPAVPVITSNGNELVSTQADQYQWIYNNAAMPSEVSQNYLAFIEGYYQVQVTDENQCSNTSAQVYYSMTKVDASISTTELSVYPNPASSNINIHMPDNFSGKLSVINSNGQKMTEMNLINNIGNSSIDLSQYANGIYMVVMTDEKGITTQKSFIKY